jgi:lysophospholipase L1-like esterase
MIKYIEMTLESRLIFIIFFILISCSPPIKNLDSKGKTIVCFGNSLTQGVGAEGEEETYPEVLGKLTGKEVINAGLSGDTTGTALIRLDVEVLNKNPFLVILELGGNDFLRHIPKEVTLKNLERIIMTIQDKGIQVALCDVSSGFILSGYRRDFKRLCQKTGAIFIPRLLEGILDNPSLKYDYIHPNGKGYRIIAQRIYQAISRYVSF